MKVTDFYYQQRDPPNLLEILGGSDSLGESHWSCIKHTNQQLPITSRLFKKNSNEVKASKG